jgi:hypothetical protein
MCRGFFIGGLIAMLVLVAAPAMAQTPKLQLQPRINAPPPKITMMPKATAGRIALQLHPGATLLNIVRDPLQNNGYVVTIKKGNAVTKVTVPAQ